MQAAVCYECGKSLVKFYRHQRLKLDEPITARYPLEQINQTGEPVDRGHTLCDVIAF